MSNQILSDTPQNADVELSIEAIKAKQDGYTKFFMYYDGDQTLQYNTQRMKKLFRNLKIDLTENWCGTVIDSTADRINLLSFATPGDEIAQKKLNKIIESMELILDSDPVHEAALIAGESFYILSQDDEITGFYNDPRLCHMFYEAGNPKKKRVAAKIWADEEKRFNLTLYYPDRFEYFRSDKKSQSGKEAKDPSFGDLTAGIFKPVDQDGNSVAAGGNLAPNPLGKIPVSHFRPNRRIIKSDLKNIVPLQDLINKFLSDMTITSEFSAFKQRWIISHMDVEGKLKNAPNEIWGLPASDGEGQDTEVGELSSSDPKAYIEPLDREVEAIAGISKTPKHFFLKGAGANISGEALITFESPLNKKVKKRIDQFRPIWREVAAMIAEMSSLKIETIVPVFDVPETVQPQTRATVRLTNVQAGIPITTVLKDEGKSQEEIDQLLEDKKTELDAAAASLGESLARSQRQFDNPEGGDD